MRLPDDTTARRSRWARPLPLFCVALGLRLIVGAALGRIVPIHDDQQDYLALAHQISLTGHFTDPRTGLATAFRDPGYPFFLRALLGQGHALWRVWLAQVLLSAATGVLLVSATRKAMGEAAAVLCAALFVARLDLAAYSFLAYSETLSMFAMAVLFDALARSGPLRGRGSGIPGVVAAAGGVLTRAATIPSFLALAAAAAVRHRASRGVAVLASLAAVVATSAWSARNWREVGSFSPNTNGTQNLYLGNSARTPLVHGYWSDSTITRPLRGLSEAANARASLRLVTEYVREQPGRAALGVLLKLPDALELDRVVIGVSRRGQFPDRSGRVLMLLGAILTLSAIPAMILGLAAVLSPGEHWLAHAGRWAFFGVVATQLLTVAYPRYSQPAWLALLPGSAMLIQRLGRRERGAVWAVIAAALVLLPVWTREVMLGGR